MAETLSILSIISFVFAVVSLALAVFLWFFFNIPSVINDLSNRGAKKSIANMRAANEKTGIKKYKGSRVNEERGKLTDSIQESGKLKSKKKGNGEQKPETGLLAENQAGGQDSEKTDILTREKTDLLKARETDLLTEKEGTVPLNTSKRKNTMRTSGKKFKMIDEVILIHTEEVIE